MDKYVNLDIAIELVQCCFKPTEEAQDLIELLTLSAQDFTHAAIEVIPVRHGHWIELENGDCKCSLCGCYHHTWEAHGYYCQHCGAKMDGDKK